MSDLLGNFARAFPVLIFLAIMIVLIVLFRSWSRVSSGSTGAGSLRTPMPRVPGLQGVPWQAVSIDDALTDSPSTVVALLLQRSEDLNLAVSIPTDLPESVQVEVLLQQMEDQLDLPALASAPAQPASPAPIPPTSPPR